MYYDHLCSMLEEPSNDKKIHPHCVHHFAAATARACTRSTPQLTLNLLCVRWKQSDAATMQVGVIHCRTLQHLSTEHHLVICAILYRRWWDLHVHSVCGCGHLVEHVDRRFLID